MEIKAAVCRATHVPVGIESIDIDRPLGREVLVRTVATGVCHSDLHVVDGDGRFPLDRGMVTLDRVVCCYPFFEPLLDQALQRAARAFAFSYPRDRWYVRLGVWLENALRRRRGNAFRTFVHPPSKMAEQIERAGFRLVSRRRTLSWSCDAFVKAS